MSIIEQVENKIIDLLTASAAGKYIVKQYPQNVEGYKPNTNKVEVLVTFAEERAKPVGNNTYESEIGFELTVIGKKVKAAKNTIILYDALEQVQETLMQEAASGGYPFVMDGIKFAGGGSDGFWIYSIGVALKVAKKV